MCKAAVHCDNCEGLKSLYIINIKHSEKGKKSYSQHDSRVIIVVTILKFMVIMVTSKFNGYVLVKIKLCGL